LKNYELLVLIKPGLDTESLTNLYKTVEEMVTKHKGEIISKEEWGKKTLAYEINKHRDGIYCLYNIKLDPVHVKSLDNDLKLNDSVLRSSCTQEMKKKPVLAPKEESVKEGGLDG